MLQRVLTESQILEHKCMTVALQKKKGLSLDSWILLFYILTCVSTTNVM